jgi:hypothetical protein
MTDSFTTSKFTNPDVKVVELPPNIYLRELK